MTHSVDNRSTTSELFLRKTIYKIFRKREMQVEKMVTKQATMGMQAQLVLLKLFIL